MILKEEDMIIKIKRLRLRNKYRKIYIQGVERTIISE
jgi:hypothetical protein